MSGFFSIAEATMWRGKRSGMERRIIYCSICFHSITGTHTVVDRIQMFPNENSLDNIFIIYPVASKHLVPPTLVILHRGSIRRLRKSSRFCICLCDYIVRCVRLKQIVHSLAVGRYCALPLTIILLRFQCDVCGKRRDSVSRHE